VLLHICCCFGIWYNKFGLDYAILLAFSSHSIYSKETRICDLLVIILVSWHRFLRICRVYLYVLVPVPDVVVSSSHHRPCISDIVIHDVPLMRHHGTQAQVLLCRCQRQKSWYL
jgi:hypothetical protein